MLHDELERVPWKETSPTIAFGSRMFSGKPCAWRSVLLMSSGPGESPQDSVSQINL